MNFNPEKVGNTVDQEKLNEFQNLLKRRTELEMQIPAGPETYDEIAEIDAAMSKFIMENPNLFSESGE